MPPLLGSFVLTAIFAVSGRMPNVNLGLVSLLSKTAIGVMLAHRLNRKSVAALGMVLKPAALVSFWFLCTSVIAGFILTQFSSLPLSTSLLGSATGGLSEMAVFALSQNFDAPTITVLGVVRLMVVLLTLPSMVSLAAKPFWGNTASETYSKTLGDIKDDSTELTGIYLFFMWVLAVAAGIAFEYAGIPAGLMMGPLAAATAINLLFKKKFSFPGQLLAAAQIGIGVAIAQDITPERLIRLADPALLAVVLLTICFMLLSSVALAFVLRKMTGWKPELCALCSSAGGMSQIVSIAEETGSDSLTVGVIHMTRFFTIIFAMPLLITFLL